MKNDQAVAFSVDALGPNLTGIGRYCLELAERLPDKLGKGNLHYFCGSHWIDNPHELLREDWKPRRTSFLTRKFGRWEKRRAMENAVVHAPNYFLPEWAERGVATVHDLSVLLYPETHPAERVLAFETGFQKTLDQARMLITDTEAVRQELITMFAISPDRIKSVSLGTPSILSSPDLALLRQFGLQPKKYILCVSTFEPRKRIDCLVRAFLELPLAMREQTPLVLAGARGWRGEALDTLIEQSAKDGTIKRLGFVSDPVLGALYASAQLFIYPSIYEGFGLPVVEAMAYGTPCLIADTPCLIEVAKGAAMIVDPDDSLAFSAKIQEALEDSVWSALAAMKGAIVAKSYSWDDCATQTAKIYREI